MLSKTKRYVARQLMHGITVSLYHAHHELWRVAHVEADGMTPSEWRKLQRLLGELKDLTDRMSLLQNSMK